MAKYNKARWANILCNSDKSPFLLIVTDGQITSQVPVTGTNLKTVRRTASSVYSVPPGHIVVSVFAPEDEKDKRTS